jgi:phosphocarrier protein HPr
MAQVSRDVTIVNRLGLHARAAAKLVNLAGRFSARIELVTAAKRADAKSIMSVLMLAATKGTELKLDADGDDAEAAAQEIAALIAGCFGEGE